MKTLCFLLLALVTLAPHARAADDKITKESFVFQKKQRAYYLFVPEGAGADAPLVVLLHGSGRNGRSLVERWQELARREGLVLAGPDASDSRMWTTADDGPDFLRALVEAVRARHPVDPRRVYLFGHSAGANYSLMLAYLDSEFYAAAAIHAGALQPDHVSRLDSVRRKLPVSLQVGTADPLFPVAVVRRTRDLLSERGFEVELTEIAGHTHWYYDRAPEINRRAWEFLKRHALDAAPGPAPRRYAKKAVDLYNEGVRRHGAGDLAGAIAAYTRALEAEPEFAEALANRGAAHTAAGDLTAALADLKRSIELAPAQPRAYLNRGVALRQLKRLKEALADFTRAVELGPTAEAHFNRGVAYEEDGQPDAALADYTRAVEFDPKLADAYAQRGILLLRRGRDAEADRDLDAAFRLNPALRTLYESYARNVRLTREVKP